MEMVLDYKGGFEFTASSRGHSVTIDLPPAMKGEDKGMTPPELFVASLASCVGMYVLFYCNGQNLPTEGMKIIANYEDSPEKPARIGKITLEICIPAGVPEEHRGPLMQMAHQCKVHNSICTAPEIEMALAVD